MPEKILQYLAEFSPTTVSVLDISILSDISCYTVSQLYYSMTNSNVFFIRFMAGESVHGE